MGGGEPPAVDDKFPPPDFGILGPRIHPFNLTVTLAVGDSLFDGRYGLTEASRAPRADARFPQ